MLCIGSLHSKDAERPDCIPTLERGNEHESQGNQRMALNNFVKNAMEIGKAIRAAPTFPTGRFEKRYCPDEVLSAEAVAPVAEFVATTAALATVAPVRSYTVPAMLPLVDWPRAIRPQQSHVPSGKKADFVISNS